MTVCVIIVKLNEPTALARLHDALVLFENARGSEGSEANGGKVEEEEEGWSPAGCPMLG